MDTYCCEICGFTYHEEHGLEADGIPPKTKWQDIDDNWICPDCGVNKIRFIPGKNQK